MVGLRHERPVAGTVIGDSARIATAVVASRITGLARVVAVASLLGATVLGDLFVAINVLPLALYDIFAGSTISSVLVPPLVRHLEQGREGRARRLAATALGTVVAGMAVIAVAMVLGRWLLADALTAGVTPALAADARSVAGLLLLLIIPQLALYAAIGVLVAIQHAKRRFLVPSVAPVVENLGLLATVAFAWWRHGTGLEVDTVPLDLIMTLAIGSGLSVLAHALVQLVGATSAMGRLGFRIAPRDPDLVDLVEPARSSFGWSAMIAVRQFVLVVAAAWAGAGGVQALEIAVLVYGLPVAIIGRPIASAALPRLAGWSDEPDRLLAGYRNSLRLASWLTVPAGAAMIALARPLAELFGQGRFDTPRAMELLGYGLAGLGAGAVAESLFEVARQTMMAITDQGRSIRRHLVRSTWLRAATVAVGVPAAVALVDGPALLLVLGLVVSGADLAALVLVHRALASHPAWDRATGSGPTRRFGHLPAIVAATVAALTPAVLLDRLLEPAWGPVSVVGLAVAVAALFAATAWLVTGRGSELAALAAALRQTDGRTLSPVGGVGQP